MVGLAEVAFPCCVDCRDSKAPRLPPASVDGTLSESLQVLVGRPLSYLNGPHAYCAVKANMGGAAEVAAEPML